MTPRADFAAGGFLSGKILSTKPGMTSLRFRLNGLRKN